MDINEYIKGNKLIEKFMKNTGRNKLAHQFQESMGLPIKDYHNSWDWLMQVIEKIESLHVNGKTESVHSDKLLNVEFGFSVEIIDGLCMIHREMLPQYYGREDDFLELYDCRKVNKIESTWLAVIEFIKWFNKQKP